MISAAKDIVLVVALGAGLYIEHVCDPRVAPDRAQASRTLAAHAAGASATLR